VLVGASTRLVPCWSSTLLIPTRHRHREHGVGVGDANFWHNEVTDAGLDLSGYLTCEHRRKG
jgi:hypothetical protein